MIPFYHPPLQAPVKGEGFIGFSGVIEQAFYWIIGI
jgi:hypothetical protein